MHVYTATLVPQTFEMIHVCVFYADDGQAWGEYIESMLNSKEYEIIVKTFDVSKALITSPSQSDGYKTALLKLLLVTPNFIINALNRRLSCLPTPEKDSNVTALLCSVEPNDLQRALSCTTWDILTVTVENDSIRKIIEHVVRKVEKLEQAGRRKDPVPAPRTRPPKVKPSPTKPEVEQPRERKPSEGSVTVPIPRRAKFKVRLYPTRVIVTPNPTEPIAISISEVPTGSDPVQLEIKGQRYTPRKINPYTYELVPPDLPAGKVQVHIYQGVEKLNSCQLLYADPDVTGFTCRNFIAQILGIPSKDTGALDQKLLEHFNTSAPDGDQCMVFPSMNAAKEASALTRDTQLPTLLHFAAYNGFSELCARLMEMPGALLAYQRLNCNGDDPADLADKANYTDLAEYLRNYVETKVTVDMMDDIYVTMQGHSLLYENLRPVVNSGYTDEGHYAYAFIYPPSQKESNDDDIPESVYMANRPTELVPDHLPNKGRRNTSTAKEPTTRGKPKALSVPRGLCLGDEIPSPGAVGSKSLEELKQIQIMVAKGQFSVEDAKQLFEAWKHRYGDSPPSFKDRQRVLEKLRETFRSTLETAEESQKLLKKTNRLGSILERVRTTRQKGRPPAPRTGDSRYVAYPIPEDSTRTSECQSDNDDYVYADPDDNRCSGTSSYSSTSGGSRGSRSSVESSGLGSTGEEVHEYKPVLRESRGANAHHRHSRRMDAVQDPMMIDVLPPPPVPPRAGARLKRDRLPSPPPR